MQDSQSCKRKSVIELNDPNKALHRTTIPLRSIAAGELYRYADLNDCT